MTDLLMTKILVLLAFLFLMWDIPGQILDGNVCSREVSVGYPQCPQQTTDSSFHALDNSSRTAISPIRRYVTYIFENRRQIN
jgi:hypothetical protein